MPKLKQDPFMSGWFDPIAYENMLKAIPPPHKSKIPPDIMKHVTMMPRLPNNPPRAESRDDSMSDDPPMPGPSDDLPKICVKKGCKTLLVGPDARWKQCPKCRKEAREWQRKRRENKDKDLPSAHGKWVIREDSDDEQVIGMLPRPVKPTKEELWKQMKPEERFREWMDQVKASGKLQDGQDIVMGRRKVGVLAEKDGVLKKTKPDNVYPEYMSAFDLCAALAKCIANAAPRPTNFRGCYCVVEAEATPISRDRALDEADKVRELAFGDFWDVDVPPVSVFKANGHHGRRVDCECLCSPDRTNKCGGTLTVKVLKVFDNVFPGEKIIVKMTHDD